MILWLFVALAAATAFGLYLFSRTVEGSQYKTVVWRALAGDLAIPVVAWFIIRGIHEADSRRRWAWWIGTVPAAAATYALVAMLLGVLRT